jgi:hypothetical protein
MLSDVERVAIAVRRMDALMPSYYRKEAKFIELLEQVCGSDRFLRQEVGRHYGAQPKRKRLVEEHLTFFDLNPR